MTIAYDRNKMLVDILRLSGKFKLLNITTRDGMKLEKELIDRLYLLNLNQ